MPDPDNFDYDAFLEQTNARGDDMGLNIGGPGTPDSINSNGRILSMEDVLVHLISEDEAALDFMHRRRTQKICRRIFILRQMGYCGRTGITCDPS